MVVTLECCYNQVAKVQHLPCCILGPLVGFPEQVTSWEEASGAPHDLGPDSDGSTPRSYVGCLSEVRAGAGGGGAAACVGATSEK